MLGLKQRFENSFLTSVPYRQKTTVPGAKKASYLRNFITKNIERPQYFWQIL